MELYSHIALGITILLNIIISFLKISYKWKVPLILLVIAAYAYVNTTVLPLLFK